MSPERLKPSRGEIWLADFSPTTGHEQHGTRPALVISMDRFNHGHSGLVIAVPLTTTNRGIPFHVSLAKGEGGLKKDSFAMCDNVRSVSRERLLKRLGKVDTPTLRLVEDRLKVLLDQ